MSVGLLGLASCGCGFVILLTCFVAHRYSTRFQYVDFVVVLILDAGCGGVSKL